MWPTWPHGACPYHHGINEAWATLDPQQLIDQLAAHIRQLHLEYDQARDRGSTHGMELAGKEIQGMQIALGRTLAWRDGLPEEHPTSAFNRGRDYMRAWAPA
ncbi:hypothetical protein ACIBCT_39045 [Streptosporangium sp. NPDC050855]|uniref:hypothetical protein n=1 Tax=Streptosporangium sp. NPDC050855 TaxID=3366194 RepID=UPI0037A456CB